MRPLAAVLLALGLPAFAAAEPEAPQFPDEAVAAADGKFSILPYFLPKPTQKPDPRPSNNASPPFNHGGFAPDECSKLHGYTACSKSGLRICIYKSKDTHKLTGKKMGGICTPRHKPYRIGTPIQARDVGEEADIPALFARATTPAASSTAKPTPSTKPKPKPKAPITPQACAALGGRRKCYKGKQVCLHKDKAGKSKVESINARCRSKPPKPAPKPPLLEAWNPPKHKPAPPPPKPTPTPKPTTTVAATPSPLPAQASSTALPPGMHRPGQQQQQPGRPHFPGYPVNYRPGGFYQRLPPPNMGNSNGGGGGGGAAPWWQQQQQWHHRRSSPPSSSSVCENVLGGFTTCLGGRRTCRYTDAHTGQPAYVSLEGGSCTSGEEAAAERPLPYEHGGRRRRSVVSGFIPRSEPKVNYAPTPPPPLSLQIPAAKLGGDFAPQQGSSAECRALKGFSACRAGKETCIYRGDNGKFQVKHLGTACTRRLPNFPTMRTSAPVVT